MWKLRLKYLGQPPSVEREGPCFIQRDPRVPALSSWLPAGIAGLSRLPEHRGEWILARRMVADIDGLPNAYRLFLPMDGITYGDGPTDYIVGISEGQLNSEHVGGAIDIATRVLDVEWDTSERAWRDACRWFKTESRLRQDDGETIEELRARGNPRGYGFAGPFDVEPGDPPMR